MDSTLIKTIVKKYWPLGVILIFSFILLFNFLKIPLNQYPSIGADWVWPFTETQSKTICQNQIFSWWERYLGESHQRPGNLPLVCSFYFFNTFLPGILILKLTVFLFMFLSGFFTYILLRKFRLSKIGSMLGSTMYMSSSWVFIFIINGWLAETYFSYAFAPLFLYSLLFSLEYYSKPWAFFSVVVSR